MVSGVPPVLSSPYLSDLERNYHHGQYHIQIQYNNPDPAPVEFIVEVAVSRDEEELLRVGSFPVVLTPGNYLYRTFDDEPSIRFPGDPVRQISAQMQEQVVREGILPEGNYMLEVEVRPSNPFVMISSVPSHTHFEIRFPQPPVLVSPIDGGNVPPVFPVFSWTPVIGMPMFQFEYELLIVEVEDGQSPLQAIEANREHARITTSQPAFVYTNEYLPLENGKQYAWQVRAREVNGQIPISDYGQTGIHMFTASDYLGDLDIDQLERIELVPGFAELVGLDNINITTGSLSLTLDGTATLRLDFTGSTGGYTEVDVYCHDLEIQIGDLENPVITGGYIDGDIRGELFPVQGVGEVVSLERIGWSLAEGLTVDAGIVDPSGEFIEAEGTLGISAAGLSGTVTATGPSGEPLFEYGIHPVELAVNSITAVFPGAYLSADAQLSFFDEPTPCYIPDMIITGDVAEFSASCPVDYEVPLVPGTDLATLYLGTVGGNILIGGENPSFEYEFTVISSLRLNAPGQDHYDIPVTLDISSETGVAADIRAPPVTHHFPDIDLGIAGMQIVRIEDPYIGYDPAANTWDFGFEFDAGLKFPSFDDLELPELYGVTIDREGIHFPQVHFDYDDLFVIPQLSLAGFGARLTSFTIPEFTFPWFDWDGDLPGPWDFEFDFELTFPEFPDHMPPCLRNLSLDVENAGFAGGEFSAVMPSTYFADDECGFDIGAGYLLSISQLGGELTGVVESDEFSIDGYLQLDAAMSLGTPFDCDGDSALELGAEDFTMNSEGIISGVITGIVPACPVSAGPYEAVVTDSELTFSSGNNGQVALLDAEAYLEFPVQSGGTNQFGGGLGIDLVTGEFTELDFAIDEPFLWTVPTDDEVLEFYIESAGISLDGLMIHGRQEFLVAGRSIGVMFNELLLDLKNFRIKEGNILFDEAFALEAGIDPADFSLTYRPVDTDDELSLDPGVMFGLAGAVMIDSGGLTSAGSADAEMAFSGFEISDLSVRFSDDFAIGLDPFKVQEGQMDLLYQDDLVAVIDEFGFHPVLSFFDLEAVLPDRLPVPHSSVAYLVLKDDAGNLLLDVEDDPENDLGVILGTRPGEPVDMVFPVLQGDLAEAPTVGVEFSDVRISLSPTRFETGQISADVSGMSEFLDLEERFGIPFSLEEIFYGSFDDFHDTFSEGLFFTGQLKLFEEELGENGLVSLFVQQDGTLLTNFDMSGVDRDIPLVPGSDIAVITINTLSGHLEFPLLTGALPVYEFNISGGFGVQYGQNMARADISARYDRQGFSLLDFEYDVEAEQPEIDIDPFIFRVDGIRNLHLDYQRGGGDLDFYAGLDLSFGMKTGGDTLLIPLRGVEIRPAGLNIPGQIINDGTDPQLAVPGITLAGIHLQPFAFKMEGAEIDIYSFTPGDLAGLLPMVDFAVTFPELAESFPAFADLSLTVYRAGYSEGRFTGSVEVYNPLEPIRIPMGTTFLDIYEFAGDLVETIGDGHAEQGIDIHISGSVPGPGIFESDDPCDPVEFSLSIVEGRGFAGRVDNFVPCGAMPIGQLSLMFTDSELQFGFEEGDQEAVLAGSAELLIPRAGDGPETATAGGNIEMDLMTGSLIDGYIEIADAFNWSLPAGAEDPFFTFIVNSARLDREGLTFRAQGEMQVTDQMLVDVDFDDLVIGLEDLRITDGEATISTGYAGSQGVTGGGFAFELLFMPVKWRMVPSDQPVPADTNVIRLNMEGIGLVLDKEGVSFTGESTANMHLAERVTETWEDDEPGEPDQPDQDDIELEFPGLKLSFVRNFCFDWSTYAVTSGAAELHRTEEDREPELLAWYDEDGLGIGDILGILPVPDTLGLPDHDIAYLVLRETDPDSPDYGDLLVELEGGAEERTLQTKDGKSVKLVLSALAGEEGEDAPTFTTGFSITVNSAFEIVGGSIDVDLENNPFKVPDLPVSLTGLAYGRRDDGTGTLTASAKLDLPESLGGLEVGMDELRFSTEGFEQVTFSVGDPVSTSDTLSSLALADSALCVNIFYATASFGSENAFGIKGSLESNLFRDEETGDLSFIPFESIYDVAGIFDEEWRFEFDLEELQRDSLAISHARLWLTGAGAVASQEEFTLSLSGVVSLPDLMGEDFGITINQLALGTNGIEVGGVEVQADSQEFSMFGDRLTVGVEQVSPDYNSQTRVLSLGFDGYLDILERRADFTNMTIGTDGSFGFDQLDIDLLADNMVIIEDHLVMTALNFGMSDEDRLQLLVSGDATLPNPFDQTSDFTVTITQTGRRSAEVDFEGIGFRFDEQRPEVDFGDIATLGLTAADLDIDFTDVTNTTFYASAELEIHSESPDDGSSRIIRFGESTNIMEDGRHGLRYSYPDNLSWHITESFSHSYDIDDDDAVLFGFSAGFFSVDVMIVTMPEDVPGFVVEMGGRAGLNLPRFEGRGLFEGFRISPDGIDEHGRFAGGLSADLMDVVTLSLTSFEYGDEPETITLIGDEDDPDPDSPDIEEIIVTEYLLIEGAGITLNGSGNGSGNGSDGEGARDAYGGGVERILVYRTDEGVSLQIEQAEITIPAASINVSMSYHTIGGYSLSVAGTGKFGFDNTGVDIGVAGKISNINDELSFGLFVKAGVEPGIPIIPQVITLKGLGGGFYYNPDVDDFDNVRNTAGLEYLEQPDFSSGTRFAVFLYAAAGLIGDPTAFIDGDIFLEITDGATSLHANAELFYQGERLQSFMSLIVAYGDNPMVQGLCSLVIDYKPALHGGSKIGFFAKPGGADGGAGSDTPNVIWAVYGESRIDFFIVKTESDFIVCNDGLLANLEIAASYDSRIISLDGSLEASVWYLRETSDMGAYGRISAMVSAGGASVRGSLLGALVRSGGERFLYAQGEVALDIIIWDGEVSAWAAYSSDGWSAGRGTNPEFEQMIEDARGQAERLQEAARQAAEEVAAAIEALNHAEFVEELMEDLDRTIQDYSSIEQRRNLMNERIEYVGGMQDEIYERLNRTIDHTIDLRDHTVDIARELENPLTYSRGTIEGEDEELVVESNPSITVDDDIAKRNESDLEEHMDEIIELQLEHYEEAIAKTLLSLRELEIMIEGKFELSSRLTDACVNVLGESFQDRVEGFSIESQISSSLGSPADHGLPGSFGGPFQGQQHGGPTDMNTEPFTAATAGTNQTFAQDPTSYQSGTGEALLPTETGFHLLSESYTEAVESVKDFYSAYIVEVYVWRGRYLWKLLDYRPMEEIELAIANMEMDKEAGLPVDERELLFLKADSVEVYELEAHVEAAENLIIEMEETYEEIYPPLITGHSTFTESLDILYTLKAEITATLYGMIEEYFALRAELPEMVALASAERRFPGGTGLTDRHAARLDVSEDEVSAELEVLRAEIVQMLEPPVISSLVINPGDPLITARNWADIQWQANHPLDVAETSYLIEPASGDQGQGQFTSAGQLSSVRHYTWRKASELIDEDNEDDPERENTYNISLRARGSGGNTTIRSSTVSLRVRPGGTSSPAGEQLHDDVPPPSTPSVELDYISVVSASSSEPEAGSADISGMSMSAPSIERIYYTNESERIRLVITAHDEYSDIREFEYALGSYPEGTDVVDWTRAVGVTGSEGPGGSGVTRSMETVIRGLDLEHDRRYYISVRVKNSAGRSSEFSMSSPVVYDSTPPEAPGFLAALEAEGLTATATGASSVAEYPVVTEAPSFEPGVVNYPSAYREPSLTRSWSPAEDPESGIWGYEYILSPVENSTEAFSMAGAGFTTEPRVTITGDQLTYTDSLYLHVRSRNNAGSTSYTALTFGPMVPADPTAPTPPVVNARVGNGVTLYIPYLSGDFESQVRGYQYSVGTYPGGTDVKEWSEGIDIEHPWETLYQSPDAAIIVPEPDEVPSHHIFSDDFPVRGGNDLYVNVRAVNGQNMFSPVVSSGPFRLDTRPEEPSLTHDFNSKTGELAINIGNIIDDGAPVSSVS